MTYLLQRMNSARIGWTTRRVEAPGLLAIRLRRTGEQVRHSSPVRGIGKAGPENATPPRPADERRHKYKIEGARLHAQAQAFRHLH